MRVRLRFVLIVLVFVFGIAVLTVLPLIQPPEDRELRGVMHGFYQVLLEIMPTLASQADFAHPDNQEKIKQSLQKMNELSEVLKSKVDSKNRGSIQIAADYFKQHTQMITEYYNLGQAEDARWMLGASFNLCVSCHTQMPVLEMPRVDWRYDLEEGRAKTAFQWAEVQFITRRFDAALEVYDYLIRQFPDHGIDVFDLETVVLRKLVIFARIERNPQRAVDSFLKDLANQKLPSHLINNIRNWIIDFESWHREKKALHLTVEKLLLQIEEKVVPKLSDRALGMESPDLVTYLRYSGLLHEKLSKEDDEALRLRILYILARIERQLASKYLFTLYEFYFKECAESKLDHPVQKECVRELQLLTRPD